MFDVKNSTINKIKKWGQTVLPQNIAQPENDGTTYEQNGNRYNKKGDTIMKTNANGNGDAMQFDNDEEAIVGTVKKVKLNPEEDRLLKEVNSIVNDTAKIVKYNSDILFSGLNSLLVDNEGRPHGTSLININNYKSSIDRGIIPLTQERYIITKKSLNGQSIEKFKELYNRVRGTELIDAAVKEAEVKYQEKEAIYKADKEKLEKTNSELSSELSSVKAAAENDKKNLEARLNESNSRLKDSETKLKDSESKYENALSTRKVVSYGNNGKTTIVEEGKEVEYIRKDSIPSLTPTILNNIDENAQFLGIPNNNEIIKFNKVFEEYARQVENNWADGFDAQNAELYAKRERVEEAYKSLIKVTAGKDEEAKSANEEKDKMGIKYVHVQYVNEQMKNMILNLFSTINHMYKTVGMQIENEEKIKIILENKEGIIEQKDEDLEDAIIISTEHIKKLREVESKYSQVLESNKILIEDNEEHRRLNSSANEEIGNLLYLVSNEKSKRRKLEHKIEMELLPLIQEYQDNITDLKLIDYGKDKTIEVMNGELETTSQNSENSLNTVNQTIEIARYFVKKTVNRENMIQTFKQKLEKMEDKYDELQEKRSKTLKDLRTEVKQIIYSERK